MDPILSTMIVVAVIGLVCWVIVTFIPMPPPFGRIVVGVAVVMTLLWLLQSFGLLHWRR